MTVRVTTLKGTEVGRYYTEHLPSYYLDGDEPPGRWRGQGASRLGLTGMVEPEAFLDVMAGCDPATGQDLGRRFGEGSVRGYDATFSAPKSVSVLFGLGDPEIRREVTEAHEAAGRGRPGLDRDSCPHPDASPWPHRVCRRRGARCRRVSPAHQSPARPTAPHPHGDRQPGYGSRRPMARPRCSHHQTGPAHPIGSVSRQPAIRVDPASRGPVAGT